MSCPACFTGAVHHNEKPTGKQATVHGLPTYIAEPPNGAAPKGIIVIIPDAFGLPFINNQTLADNYASKGQFRVYLPDFMDGQPAPTWMMQTFSNVFATKALWNWIRKPYDIGCAMYGFLPFVIRNSIVQFVTSARKSYRKVGNAIGLQPVLCLKIWPLKLLLQI